MGVYATAQQVRDYAAARGVADGVLPTDDDDLEALISIAEEDVDQVVGGPREPVTGRVWPDPSLLLDHQQGALARAAAAAVIWRASLGGRLLEGDTGERITLAIGGVQSAMFPAARPPAPSVAEELAGHGLVLRSGIASPDA